MKGGGGTGRRGQLGEISIEIRVDGEKVMICVYPALHLSNKVYIRTEYNDGMQLIEVARHEGATPIQFTNYCTNLNHIDIVHNPKK